MSCDKQQGYYDNCVLDSSVSNEDIIKGQRSNYEFNVIRR